jgi:hypothetical protein
MKKKDSNLLIRSSAAEYLTFVAAAGNSGQSFEMRYEDENIWLTQKMMSALYEVEVPTINEHIARIYSDNELEETATIRNFRIVQTEGKRQVSRDVKHYNLQMIIAVGFKVNNERAVQCGNFIRRLRTFTRLPLITTRRQKPRGNFSRRFRTNCTGPFMAAPPPS